MKTNEALSEIPGSWHQLEQDFFARPAPLVAAELIGCVLLRRTNSDSVQKQAWIGGVITETEAYTEDDEASHSFKGTTARNASMFGEAGMIYVYRSYGIHRCLNISTGKKGQGEAVLIRALAATFGSDMMLPGADPSPTRYCSGPGRLCAALGITLDMDGQMQGEGEIAVYRTTMEADYERATGQRIGISKAVDKHWRFGLKGHPSLSKPFKNEARVKKKPRKGGA